MPTMVIAAWTWLAMAAAVSAQTVSATAGANLALCDAVYEILSNACQTGNAAVPQPIAIPQGYEIVPR